MEALHKLLKVKRPSKMFLLDMALALTLLPHLFVFDAFLVLYLLLALYLIFKKEYRVLHAYFLFFGGVLAIGGAYFESYNLANFSRMQFFVSFVSAALLLAVVLQRHKREINFYLLLSPALFMLLSFFFFDTIAMLFYSIFAFFILMGLLIWSRMDATLAELLRLNSLLFLLSMPAVILLFIAFPRISFEKAEFGFRGDLYTSNFFDGSMLVDGRSFEAGERVVMEIFFKESLPLENQLYFRGSVLYPKSALVWEEKDDEPEDFLIQKEHLIDYDLLLHPQGKKWLFALDMPTLTPNKSNLQKGMTLRSENEIHKSKRYSLQAALHYRLVSNALGETLEVNATAYPKTAAYLKNITAKTPREKADALLAFFTSLRLAYTVKPYDLDAKNPVDSFLFEAKNGYCTHFASSFAIAARLLGVPSRVVSGYKADYTSRVENYLVVKEKDAHAWVELYLGEEGWVRFEPTATAFKNLDIEEQKEDAKEKEGLFHRVNLHYMYVKYLINSWILGFDRSKQVQIVQALLSDTLYLLRFVGAFFGVVFVLFLLAFLIQNQKSRDPLMQAMNQLLKLLEKKGVHKESHESMEHFLLHVQDELKVPMKSLIEAYHDAKYAMQNAALQRVLSEIKKIRAELT